MMPKLNMAITTIKNQATPNKKIKTKTFWNYSYIDIDIGSPITTSHGVTIVVKNPNMHVFSITDTLSVKDFDSASITLENIDDSTVRISVSGAERLWGLTTIEVSSNENLWGGKRAFALGFALRWAA